MAGTKVDPTGTVTESVRLIFSDVANNNNKAWFGHLYDSGDVKVEWGAVGKSLQWCTHIGAGSRKLEDLKRSKLKKGYTEQRTIATDGNTGGKKVTVAKSSVRDVAAKQIKHSNPVVAKLIGFLSDANIHDIVSNSLITVNASGDLETPYGLVESSAIADARRLLVTIGDHVHKRDWDSDKVLQVFGDYFRLVPQDVPRDNRRRRLNIQGFIPDVRAVQKQNDLLDALDASLQKAMTAPTLKSKKDGTEKVFDVKLDVVEEEKTVDQVRRKYRNTKGGHHDVSHLDVKTVYQVRINTVHDAFVKHGKKIGNTKQLWHGTKASNLLSILKGGLIIPPTSSGHVTGRMFGDGLYFSDQSTKSIRYATGAWGYGGRTDRTFMFLAQVACGKEHVPRGSDWNFRLPSGYDSCFAKAGVSGVQNNEFIVYHTNQADLVYLIEFSSGGR